MQPNRPSRLEGITPALARGLGLGLLSLGIAAYIWWPMIGAWRNTQNGDGQYFHKLVEAVRVSVVHHHELPLWDPYECGGRPLWDNPQSLAAAPLIWLAFVIGTTVTMKIWYVVHTAAGFASMWLFCRKDLRVSREAAFAASLAWASVGFNMRHLSGGHAAFVGFLYMPLALWLWRSAEKEDTHAIWLGLVVALVELEGGALPLLYLAVLLGCETLTRAWRFRRVPRIARAGALVLAVALGTGAVRFLPVIDQLRSHKRPLPIDTDGMSWTMVFEAFTDRTFAHSHRFAGQSYVWGEYATFIGLLLLGFALIGMVLGGLEYLWLAALLVVSIALMVGYHGQLSPWSILNRHVYPIKEMRVPSRFNAEASFVLLAFVALAVDRLKVMVRRIPSLPPTVGPFVPWVIPLLAIVGAGEVMGASTPLVSEFAASATPQDSHVKPSEHLYLGGPGLAAYIDQPQQNRGRLQCYEPWSFYDGAPLWQGDVPQVRSASATARISNDRRTQNTFTFDVDADAPTRVLLNSSFDYNWRANVGKPEAQAKQLVVDVPAGRHHVQVRYWPRLLTLGAFVSLVSASLVVWALRRLRKETPAS